MISHDILDNEFKWDYAEVQKIALTKMHDINQLITFAGNFKKKTNLLNFEKDCVQSWSLK